MLENLHFLQPYWLLAFIPLALLWWWAATRARYGDAKAWRKVIDANLLPLLLGGPDDNHQPKSLAKWLLFIGWFITTIALANPVWEKIPRPVFQSNTARVIVLDLSSSMLINDLKPSRLARARFKIEDILSEEFTKNEEGQTGLVLFAGDAFTASPLTRDSETIRALLQILTPKIMPSQGSRADLGIIKAQELLTQAGVERGQVLLIADGVSDKDATLKAAQYLKKNGHSLSVLGVGTELGGILPNLKYRDGKSITVKLEQEILSQLAQDGGGNYHLISTDNKDLKRVLSKSFNVNSLKKSQEKSDESQREDWRSTGSFIILMLLPLAALAFRRGWLFSFFTVALLIGVTHPQPVMAASFTDDKIIKPMTHIWDNLWSNKEQQADRALMKEEYDKVNTLSKKPLMLGSAQYKKGAYKEALDNFKQAKGADARYNEGNALAKLEKYQEAIKAYDKALKIRPTMQDAIKNKESIKALLGQKKPENEEGDKNKKNGENKGEEKDNGAEGEKGKEGEAEKESGESGESDNKKGDESNNQFSDANKELDKGKSEKDKSDAKKASQELPENKSTEKKGNDKGEDEGLTSKEAQKEKGDKEGTNAEAEELTKEEKMAAEQWLRRIPDDPGGLLRRKFQRQYQQQRRRLNSTGQPW